MNAVVGVAKSQRKLVVRVRESVMRAMLARLSDLGEELQPPYTIVAMTLHNASLAAFS